MIHVSDFVGALQSRSMDFFVGVPDSLLKDFCAYVDDNFSDDKNIIAANEGTAVAMASGYHMATKKIAVVYLQNSGLGNVVNPLTSIADKEVYSIPMLLIIGWRGEPGIKDEPQHIKQGRITLPQLDILEIPYLVVNSQSNADEVAAWAQQRLDVTGAPVALVVQNGTFAPYKGLSQSKFPSTLKREAALELILRLANDAAVISTTGKTSREVFELRVRKQEEQRDFLTVGGMGHTASIALGVALGQPKKQVVCLDGDGSVLMHMGALPIIGSLQPENFIHVLLNNASHESVGGQPTVADRMDFEAIALACGYRSFASVSTENELIDAWHRLVKSHGPVMLEVRIALGSRADLGRPSSTPNENKKAFMCWVQS